MNLLEKLKEIQNQKKAMLAANFYNLETCRAIVLAATKLNCPVILQLTPSSIKYMGLKTSIGIARNLSDDSGTQTWVHLDHCNDIELIKKCLDEGINSVMIDASDKELDENISITSGVVNLAKSYRINVEAELGVVPKPETDIDVNKFTSPKEARRFVEETGVTSLAIAVGSKHGFYRGIPRINIERIREIKKVTDVFLVLHGASGIPSDILKEAIKNGITKVNVATDTKDLFMSSLKETLNSNNDIDLRNTFPFAVNKVQKMIEEKIKVVSMVN